MWDYFKEWLSEPYQDDADAMHWFLFIGLIIVSTLAWTFILKHLRGVQ